MLPPQTHRVFSSIKQRHELAGQQARQRQLQAALQPGQGQPKGVQARLPSVAQQAHQLARLGRRVLQGGGQRLCQVTASPGSQLAPLLLAERQVGGHKRNVHADPEIIPHQHMKRT